MLEKLKAIEERFIELENRMAQPEVYSDVNAYAKLAKDQKELAPVVEAYRLYKKYDSNAKEAKALLSDPEMKEMAQEELEEAKEGMENTLEQLKILLLPKDPNDDKNVIVEIRGGAGGDEAALFANSLYRMYSMPSQSAGRPKSRTSMKPRLEELRRSASLSRARAHIPA